MNRDCNVYVTISKTDDEEGLRIVVDRQYKDGKTTHHAHIVLGQIHSYVYRKLPKILDKATSVRYKKGDRALKGRGWVTQYFFSSKKKISPEFPSLET